MAVKLDLNQFRYQGKYEEESEDVVTAKDPEPISVQSSREPGTIPPLLVPNLLLVFIGFNPGRESGRVGHHYAHRSNRFWKFIYLSGLVNEKLTPSQDVELPEKYRYGFTDLVKRWTKSASELSLAEQLEGARLLEERLDKVKPKYIAVIGKGIWEMICRYKGWPHKALEWGIQPQKFAGAVPFLLPSTSGLVSIGAEKQLKYWSILHDLIEEERSKTVTALKQEPEETPVHI